MERTRHLSLFPACALAACLAFSPAPSWGEDGARGAQDAGNGISAGPAQRPGPLDDDIASVRASVRDDPSSAPLRVRLGYLLVQQGALDEAMRSFDEALKLNPRSCDAKTGRGVVLSRKGKLQEAEQALREALILNPSPVRTHYELGLVYGKLGDLEKALAEFKEGIKKHEQGR